MNKSSDRRPSPEYYYCSAAAAIALVCIIIAIDGTRRTAAGGHDMSSINTAGVGALIFAWALNYFMRLAFASSLSSARQALVILTTRVIFAAEILLAVVGLFYVFGSPTATSAVQGFIVIGSLLQIGTLLWLIRYSREGLSGGSER